MKATTITFIFLFFSLVFVGCFPDEKEEPTIIIEPDPILLTASDTLATGSYLGFTIGETAENIYTSVTDFKASTSISYLNVVSNIVSGIDRKSTRLNSSHVKISYAVFHLKK